MLCAKAEFSPSLQHRLFSCIFKAFLTMLLGLDLCRDDCRASCCWENPDEAKEGRAGSIPICRGWGGQMWSSYLNCSELGLMLYSPSHPQPCIPPPPLVAPIPSPLGSKQAENVSSENG